MANNKNKEKESEFFMDQNNDDDQDIEAIKYESESGSDNDNDNDEGNRRTHPQSFSSQIWPQSYKEATDSYTIAAAPNFESAMEDRSQTVLKLAGMVTRLSDRLHLFIFLQRSTKKW
ncbi:PREDICTED: uncharacterized protein LOC109358922 [Lupinus angustifolius]|uniref:uncharacterized protein LOC109358922 n=1 Tax=Lupinus angustifolius TaxID=3871 RepID=UPI00092FD8BB|nr:PREDICTED: uncharacterized protein LOC109358922 [Lupinus angustifolius]